MTKEQRINRIKEVHAQFKQRRFAEEWGMDVDRVGQMVNLARECGKLNEHACNGDPHPLNKLSPDDKNKNSDLWEHDCAVSTQSLLRFVETYGFTEVDYGGLFPSLKKHNQWVEIPY